MKIFTLFYDIKNFLLDHDFKVSFWSGILSGIVVSAIVGFVVYKFTGVFKSPELSFVVKQDGFYRDSILLTEEEKNYKARFQFAIKNSGNLAIKTGEGYWHLYIDTTSPTIFSAPEEQNHNRDLIRGTVYPGSFLDVNFVYELTIKKEDLEKSKIPYFFGTDYGQYPKTAKIDKSTGKVMFKNMSFINFELPN